MKLTPLKSSNIEACAFDPETKVLTIKFKSGGTYHYSGCSQDHFDGLCGADSAGRYFHKHIKSGEFKWTKADTKKQ